MLSMIKVDIPTIELSYRISRLEFIEISGQVHLDVGRRRWFEHACVTSLKPGTGYGFANPPNKPVSER
jgi:hypothetical protein